MKATMSVAESLKRFRVDRKFSQDDMARKMKVSRTMYQSYEYGKAEPSVKYLINLAEAEDVSADYLLGLIDEPRPWQVADSKATVSAGDLEARVSRLEAAVAALQAKGDSSAGDDIAQPVSSPV